MILSSVWIQGLRVRVSRNPFAWQQGRSRRQRGFTLVELLLVISIVALLASITVPLFSVLRDRAGGVVCIGNLRGLHSGFNLYMQDHNMVWPQFPTKEGYDNEVDEWRFWSDSLKEYNISRKHWICVGDADAIKAEREKRQNDFHGSYTVTQFDEYPGTAMKWKMPWLIERGGFHGDNDGPNMVMPDGSIQKGIPMPPLPK